MLTSFTSRVQSSNLYSKHTEFFFSDEYISRITANRSSLDSPRSPPMATASSWSSIASKLSYSVTRFTRVATVSSPETKVSS
jgi:hypothetical protein